MGSGQSRQKLLVLSFAVPLITKCRRVSIGLLALQLPSCRCSWLVLPVFHQSQPDRTCQHIVWLLDLKSQLSGCLVMLKASLSSKKYWLACKLQVEFLRRRLVLSFKWQITLPILSQTDVCIHKHIHTQTTKTSPQIPAAEEELALEAQSQVRQAWVAIL